MVTSDTSPPILLEDMVAEYDALAAKYRALVNSHDELRNDYVQRVMQIHAARVRERPSVGIFHKVFKGSAK